MDQEHGKSPMEHPEEQPAGVEGSPRFGRLLLVLVAAVAIIALVTVLSEQYLSGR